MANFDAIIGQETAKKLLDSAIRNGRIAHAYLFIGPANLGKFKLALEFAKIIQRPSEEAVDSEQARDRGIRIESGTDPDVLIIDALNNGKENSFEEEKNISIEKIRDLEHHLSLFPYNSKYKIAIVNQAHKFTSEAVNAFLKTLEEPRGNSVIILIAENRQLLPATLISRVQTIRFWPVKDKIISDFLVDKGLSGADAEKIAVFSGGRPGLAVDLMNNEERLSDYAGELENFRRFISGSLEDRFSFAEKMAKDEGEIQKALGLWLSFSRGMIIEKYFAGNHSGKSGANVGTGSLVKFAKSLNLTINLISTSNVNKKLALENLALEISAS